MPLERGFNLGSKQAELSKTTADLRPEKRAQA